MIKIYYNIKFLTIIFTFMKKILDCFKKNYIFIIIFLFFIFTRIYNFSDVIRYESAQWILQTIQLITIKWQIFHLIPHFPLAVILYKIWALIAWNSIIWISMMHLFLNILTFFLVYKTALLLYNDKKVANRSILLYTISFYAYAWNTMWIDQDLAINSLLFIFTLYLYKKYSEFSFKNILLIALSCSLLTISRPILWIIIMWIIFIDMISNYIVNNRKKIKISWVMENVINFLKLFIPYLIIWWLLSYLMFKLFPSPVLKSLNMYKNMFMWVNSWWSLITKVAFLGNVFMYTSPLILSLVFLFKKYSKHQTIIISSIIMILYTSIWLSWWDPARWMMPILPIFVIGWWYLCSKYINKKNAIWIIIIAIIIVVFNTALLNYNNLPININDYLSNMFNRVFLLQSTIFNPIFLDTKLVFWIAWFSLVFFILFLLSKNTKIKALFFVFSLWVNVSLISIHLLQIKQPRISSIWRQMYEYCAENCNLDQKVYSDQLTKDTIMLWLRNKDIGSYFRLQPSTEITETSNKLLKQPINLTWVNLFTEGLPKWDILDVIKNNWSWFVFLTHYFNNNEDVNLLNKECKIIKRFDWNINEIYWIVYLCDL